MLSADDRCFVCGRDNAGGLRLAFSYPQDGASAETVFVPGQTYQGWQGIVHGGMIMTVLDEVMAKAAAHRGYNVVTAQITVRLKSPAKVGEPLHCRGFIDSVKKNIVYAGATAARQDGAIIARASAKLVIMG